MSNLTTDGGDGAGGSARWNGTALDLVDITMDRNFFLLLAALSTAMLWVVYIVYYNSRILGFLLTRLVNKFYFQDDSFKIGSITLNALSGKIMFRDIVYINYNYSVRIQDGYLVFRWWRSYVPKDASEDLSHSDTRLSIVLNGFELHFYNRCELYAELEKLFGLEPMMKQEGPEECGDDERAMNSVNSARRRAARAEAALARTWRDLIPVIKADVCCARVVFGNRLVPTSLSVQLEEAHLLYSTKPPASSLDHLMHFVKAKADNCKVMLAPSPNYTAMVDEPPRYMGEGFVVMSSNYLEAYCYMDEPGLVPERPVLLRLANGDVVEAAPPIAGIDVKCGKGTDFSYGPWADRQRDHLFRFFFPPTYKNMEVTPQPKPGDRRQMQSFDIRLSTLNEATIDILFTKNKETNAVHINVGAGSYLEVTLPWLVLQDGCTTRITGQLLHLEATTSLQYRSLAESETLEYTVKCHYPLVWNHHQCWQLSLTGCKATANIVYTHIDFFQDLVNDWASKARPDILHFVPYTWKISLLLKECEVITISNQYNWIDCSSTNQENNHVAFCGDLLDVSFDLPFVDFLPDVIPLKIWIQGEAVDMSLYLPEVNTSRLLLLSIDKNMKLLPCRLRASKWRRRCVKSQGWVDCWSVPIVALSVRYSYHPVPPLGPEPQADITTPEKEEILLSPMRIPRMRKQPQLSWPTDGAHFDRTSLAPDKVSLELEVGPSVMLAYGTIITSFMNLLENFFGEDQTFTDMQKEPNLDVYCDAASGGGEGVVETETSPPPDPRRARPLDVTVSVIIHDIQAHLVKNCSENEPPCPVVLIERFGFEMDKSFRETKLQLLLSPAVLLSGSNPARPGSAGPLAQGHLVLSSLQLRGHGFFSDAGRTMEQDTIEYAWMLELQLGRLTGRLTLPQLYHVAAALETFALLLEDSENELFPPNPAVVCHHGVVDALCSESRPELRYRCPAPDDIKYRMVRAGLDAADVWLGEGGAALQGAARGARAAWCNLRGPGAAHAATLLLPDALLTLYTQRGDADADWLRAGELRPGPLLLETAAALPTSPPDLHLVQHKFLRLHDEKTRRLRFLWGEGRGGQCGCVGGCQFFGSNRNGPTFLRPSASEAADELNVASFHVSAIPGEWGYGQSLLVPGQLVFHTPPYGRHVRLVPRPPPPPPPAPPRGDVPYSRLVEPRPVQLESSVSDSRLALGGRRSDSRYSLDSPPAPPRRAASITSENHSEAFFSADEDVFPSRSSSLKHSFGSRHERPPPPPAPPAVPPEPEPAPADSESGSVSSTSFISAISSQEDMTLVNLHMQSSKPIAESPLLMSSYAAHLPVYRCADWARCGPGGAGGEAGGMGPLFRRAEDGTLQYAGGRYVPHFEPLSRAELLRLAPRREPPAAPPPPPRAHPPPPAWWDAHEPPGPTTPHEPGAHSERLGVLLTLRGDSHALLTPLLLESAQRFVEALTPVLGGVHPVAVVSHLRRCCVAAVTRANVLKQKRHVLDWLPAMRARERGAGGVGVGGPHDPPAVYSASLDSRLHVTASAPRLNVILVQSSVVEDMISFSLLDNLCELTCVSWCGVSLEGGTARLTHHRRGEDALQLYYRPALRPKHSKKSFGIMKGARPPLRPPRGDPVYIEAAKHQREDINFTLNIGKMHCQLRRVRTEATQLKDATITGIPSQQSKVSFKFVRVDPSQDQPDGTSQSSASESQQKESSLGYIMFECGVEGVAVKVSRHSAQEAGDDPAPPPASASDTAPPTRPATNEDLFRKRDSGSKPSTPNLGGGTEGPEPSGEGAGGPGGEGESPRAPPSPAANASSCAVDLKLVWFNFAAPPRTPINRKIDYTRLDWNLLSTASPAINAWMNPCNRLAIRAVSLYRALRRRHAATAACLMAGALDLAPHHQPPASRYGRHTALARQLRQEPSLQLCGVLVRHALQADAAAVQADLADRHLPTLTTLRQGVIVLTRQWKNILYTPLLLEHGYRSKVLKPLNVTFALPDLIEESGSWAEGGVGAGGGGADPDAADESCLLLHTHHAQPDVVEDATGAASRAGTGGGARGGGADEEDAGSLCSGGGGAAPGHTRPHPHPHPAPREDLYQWMAKQDPVTTEGGAGGALARLEAAAQRPACSLCPLQGELMLLDAHLVFQPLLEALGICPHQVTQGESKKGEGGGGGGGGGGPALESLGSRLSLQVWLEAARADIVVGELGRTRRQQPPAETDTYALLCEKVCVDAELRRVADAAVGELVARRRVLYVSRSQLKRHITTVLHFTLGARFISQQVNMPLLRLLHQISTMYQNVKDTQVELRGQVRHRPDHHASSSVSDFRENLVSVSSLERDTQYSTLESKWELSTDSAPPPTPTPAPATPTPTVAPTPAKPTRPRPQSFAQKLRSTGKSVKGKLGYSSLSEGGHTPQCTTSTGAAGVTGVVGGAAGEGGGPPAHALAPRCWRTLYLLLDLYATMPDADIMTHRFSVTTELPERRAGSMRASRPRDAAAPPPPMGMVVVGVAKVHRTLVLASLSGLKLEAELTSLAGQVSASRSRHWALTGTLGRSTLQLLERPHQVVVRACVGKSQALHSWDSPAEGCGLGWADGALLVGVGAVRVELPQHPVALHGVMTRSSRQLSTTLQELGVRRSNPRASSATGVAGTGGGASSAGGGGGASSAPPPATPPPPPRPAPPPAPGPTRPTPQLTFSASVQSLSITAALLPSLQAQYKMEQVTGNGVTGDQPHFTIDLSHHSLSFVTKLPAGQSGTGGGGAGGLPAGAVVALPGVGVVACVREAPGGREGGAVLRPGRYLHATAHIGLFEHTLSTDLLNHLVFVQKVFMKEVNEVVQKVSGGEKPVPLWGEEGSGPGGGEMGATRALFSLTIRIARVQLTATTPSNSCVRLETGAVELELSNRVQNVPHSLSDCRLFARAQVDINLSLGQLIRNAMFEEAEPEFQQYAFFKTRISMRNAFQDEMSGETRAEEGSEDGGAGEGEGAGEGGAEGDVVLIRLRRPLVYVQPVAVDRAILVWLNYRNAYDYWNEKRRALNTEVLHATQQLIEKVQLTSQMATPHLSTLFLQLDVDDIGICLPLNPPPLLACGVSSGVGLWGEAEGRGAVVVTLASTSVSACSSGALVSKGRFVGLCLRFAHDFEASLDDWQPRADEPQLNVCCVSEGTYEVCSRTTPAKHNENAKWFLNVSWQMEGVDIHLDVSVGKQLSALGHTLTMLTGIEEEDPLKMDFDSDFDDEADISKGSQESVAVRRRGGELPAFVFDPRLDARQRGKLIEHEMNEQNKIINDLRALGASHSTIEYEMKRLHDLEALVFKDFRRDMIQKLRRQSVRAQGLTRTQLGLGGGGGGGGAGRSRSFVEPPSPSPQSAPPLPDPATHRLPDIGELTQPFDLDVELRGPSRSMSVRSSGGGGGGGGGGSRRPPSMTRQSSLPCAPDHWPDLDEEVELRRKPDNSSFDGVGPGPGAAGGGGGGGETRGKGVPEPNIDFELDVKVHINSGKCVLHTNPTTATTHDERLMRGCRVGRSASAGGPGGVGATQGGGGVAGGAGGECGSPSARRKHVSARTHPAIDTTVFRVPGLDFKVHYESKTLPEESAPATSLSPPPPAGGVSGGAGVRKAGGKKAALFAWITLQSIPEETLVSPHILEFLEHALEPIPLKPPPPVPASGDGAAEEGAGAGAYGQYVYASFPVDVIVHFHMQGSTLRFSCLPASRVECLLQLPELQIVFSSKRPTIEELQQGAGAAMGGLSVTGCLADFSVYMFHPYGGKKSSLKEAQWSPLADSERKDSLSINVEFVKFHLSRSRKLDFHRDHDTSKATVRFSTIVDVGSAWFKYDMRRLGEILSFPKAWYRRTIVRRMFLGDLSAPTPAPTHTPHPTNRHHTSMSNNVPVSPMLPQREKSKTETQKTKEQAAWETLVLFAVNFTKLNVHMNMGNVMGNVSWQSRDFNCSGRLSIGSTGHRNMLLRVALAGSALDARGGIVGGAISLSAIHTYVHISEEPGGMPAHVCGARLAAVELRLEYMGTPVLLARVSRLHAAARDDWHQPRRPAIILAHGTLTWQQLQLLMSRSTTPDLLKMQLKLEEFFTQQFKSSKRVFSSLHPDYRGRRAQDRLNQAAAGAGGTGETDERRHHRHWQRVLSLLAGRHLATLTALDMVVGGTMQLAGAHVSLACFHGNSFKSKSWALFSLKDPAITFATEAQQQPATDTGEMEVVVVQSLRAGLGGVGGAEGGGGGGPAHQSMATVCRMTRAKLFPPQFKTLREWFTYAFASSEIDAIELFPSLEREGGPVAPGTTGTGTVADGSLERRGKGGAGGGGGGAGAAGGDHTREVIFALPSLQLHLRTQHRQAHSPPALEEPKPVVECSFITEFEDHIFVSVDAEAFLFLHDLISSYIKEKDRLMPGGGSSSSAAGGAARARGEDYRDYNCVTWHLEPTVRLLSWAGKSIEPYGVDYILQQLGFRHARTTIPKWLQRGALDPLDSLLALALARLAHLQTKH